MNTAIANRLNKGISLKTRYLVVVAAGALAASALAVAAPWEPSSVRPVASSNAGRIQLVRTQPVHTFYLVATDEERIAVLFAASEEAQSYDASRRAASWPTVDFSARNMTVLVAGSPASDASLYERAETLRQTGQDFTIVDSTLQPLRR